MNNRSTKLRPGAGLLLAALLGITLTAYAAQRMNGLQIGPNPSTTTFEVVSGGDAIWKEKADHSSTPSAGFGYLWVKDTTPSTLIFTNDAGSDTTLGSGGGGGGITDGDTLSTGLTFPNTGLHLLDSNATHDLILKPGSNLTADRELTITTGDAARTLDLSAGNATVSGTNTGDQTITLTGDVTGTGTGTFGTTIAAGAVDIAMLSATGTPSGTTYLRGDNTWATLTGGGDVSDGDTLSIGLIFPNSGLKFLDFDDSHVIEIGTSSNITANRFLGINTGDSDRELTFAGDATISGTNTGDATLAGTPDYITRSGQVFTLGLVDLAADVTGTLPAAAVGTGLTDAQVSDTLTASKVVGSGSTTDAVDAATAELAGNIPVARHNSGTGADGTTFWRGDGVWAAPPVTASSTNTLSNKRLTKRVGTTTSSATPTINTDNYDLYIITAQTVDITSLTTNLSGTPATGDTFDLWITGTAARAITPGASFASGAATFPTTTVTTKTLYIRLVWDGSIWRCMATGSNP